jgi:hypothetical protein
MEIISLSSLKYDSITTFLTPVSVPDLHRIDAFSNPVYPEAVAACSSHKKGRKYFAIRRKTMQKDSISAYWIIMLKVG